MVNKDCFNDHVIHSASSSYYVRRRGTHKYSLMNKKAHYSWLIPAGFIISRGIHEMPRDL